MKKEDNYDYFVERLFLSAHLSRIFLNEINIEVFNRLMETNESSFPTMNSPPVPLSPSNRAVRTLSPVSPVISTANTFDDNSKFPFKISRLVYCSELHRIRY